MAEATSAELSTCTFQWKIENISHCWWLRKGQGIVSPTFIADGPEGTKWSLTLYPLGYQDEKNIGVYVKREDSDGPHIVKVHYELKFLDKNGLILEKRSDSKNFKKNETDGYSEFTDIERVFVTGREAYLPEDSLNVQCTLSYNQEIHLKPQYIYGRTIFKVKRKSVKWEISKFMTLESRRKKYYRDDLISFDLVLDKNKLELKLDKISFVRRLKYFSCCVFSLYSLSGQKENCGIQQYLPSDMKNGTLTLKLNFSDKFMEKKDKYLTDGVMPLELVFTTVHSKMELF